MLLIPIKRPAVTMAGKIGIKISAKILIPRCKGFCFLPAASFTSSLVASRIPVFLLPLLDILYRRFLDQ